MVGEDEVERSVFSHLVPLRDRDLLSPGVVVFGDCTAGHFVVIADEEGGSRAEVGGSGRILLSFRRHRK